MKNRLSMTRPSTQYKVRIEQNIEARMRDGVILRADIARPTTRGRFPVILHRTPYGKSAEDTTLARAGYVVISQDMRGRYASDGEFTPLFMPGHRDAEDGYDSVEWAAGLSCSNGKIGVSGISYPSWASWELASLRPPHLVAMFNGGFGTRMTDWEVGGVLRIGRAQQWLFNSLAPDLRRRKGLGPPHLRDDANALAQKDRDKLLWYLPQRELPGEFVEPCREMWDYWLDNQHEDNFDFCRRHQDVDVPVMHMTGWHDRLSLTVDHFTGMQANGRSQATRNAQRMIVGPWPHGDNGPRQVGEMDFGKSAEVDYSELMLRWFDYWLKGKQNGIMRTAPVRYFMMGENRWHNAESWPLPGSKLKPFYLDSRGKANTPKGDGTLMRRAPAKRTGDRYDYDPRDPLMTLFGPDCQDGPFDQRSLDGRKDVLVYQTSPLRKSVRMVGRAEIVLYASSSARDTDFIFKLMDVHPDGFSHQLSYGIVRARYRDGFKRPRLLKPGQVYRFDVRMQPVAVQIKPGHRIRLDVTSSDFPNFDRNHNVGGDDYAGALLKVARQTIFHGPGKLSCLKLPVIAD